MPEAGIFFFVSKILKIDYEFHPFGYTFVLCASIMI